MNRLSPWIPTRRFGRTDIAMPVFSCGGMRYQHSWKDDEADGITSDGQKNLEAIIDHALSLGINHIETARGYGTSELQLGRILPQLKRDELIVQTKIGPRDDPAEFKRSFETSIKNLNLDYVDLLGIHGLNNEDTLNQALRKGGCLDMARSLQKDGRCRFIGFSTHGPPDLICKAIRSGEFDYVNLHWYFVNPFTWPAVEAAKTQDMGVFIISPNDKGGVLYKPTDVMKKLCTPLTPMQFNDLFCLSRPEVHTLSLGASRPGDFDEHVNALDYLADDALIRDTEKRLNGKIQRVLGRKWADQWHVGLPSWEEAPGGVNVHEILRLWNHARALGLTEWAKMRYNLLGTADHWFPGKNASELDLDAMERSLADHPFASSIPHMLTEAHAGLFEMPAKRLSES